MSRKPEYDIMRAVAVLLVILHHIFLVVNTSKVSPVLQFLQRGGYIGVDLFFVLSGFLVAGLLFKEYKEREHADVVRFLIRRGFKIYPAFYVMIGLTKVLPITGVIPGFRRILPEILYVSDYFPAIYGHTWSLAIEEQFYLLLALITFLIIRYTRKIYYMPITLTILGVIGFIIRIRTALLVNRFLPAILYYPAHLRADGLVLGVLIAYVYHFHREAFGRFAARYRFILLSTAPLLLFPAFIFGMVSPWSYTIGYTLFAFSGAFMLIALTAIKAPRFLRPLAAIGEKSYSIYLWNIPVCYWSNRALALIFPGVKDPLVQVLFYILASLFVGMLFSWLIERPFLFIRDKYFPSIKQSQTPNQVPATLVADNRP